ncbi:adenylate/guanylate cyclase domain-containing protein, partial [Desulfobacterales bacterium HSG17]|nr:adenylate/guanylate cyclase domain-containing protein [Desulfobacterales bacterium HSG17]
KLSPTEITGLLNEFLTEMTDIILKYEGTVDKYEGDAIIAFFGAPNYIDNQAETACKVCIEMQKKLVELREKWKTEKRPQMKMRIGMCTGFAVVGNLGSKSRMDYTMIGDTVNTAARLEGANKLYGSYSIVSETTAMEAGTNIILRELDLILTVGKKKPIKIYEIIGLRNDIDENTSHALTYFNAGLEQYRKQNWAPAIEIFEKTLGLIPDDEPSKAMIKRCNEYKETPPPENWGGVYTSRVK